MNSVSEVPERLAQGGKGRWSISAGGTAPLQTIPAFLARGASAAATERTRVLLVSGLSGLQEDVSLGVRRGNSSPPALGSTVRDLGRRSGI